MNLLTTATSTEVAHLSLPIAVLPVGSFEQHGDHLPLATDTIIACAIADAVADAYQLLLLLPPITIACSHEHADWPGTVSISAATLATIVTDVAGSLRARRIDRLALVNGHGGNYVLSNVVQQASVEEPAMVLFPGRGDWTRARTEAGIATSNHDDMHAGELETSVLLHLDPQLVKPSFTAADHDAPNRPLLLTVGIRGYTESGVIGKPSLATAAKGKAVLDSLVESFSDYLDALKVRRRGR